MKWRIGVILDTHGLLRREAVEALAGCDHIIHAGDAGEPEILVRLRAIAPVTVVRGNVDHGAWAQELPANAIVRVGRTLFYVLHDVHDLDLAAVGTEIGAVVSGHSHQPSIRHDGGVLYLNPGSAGPRRFRLPVSLAMVEITKGGLLEPRLVTLWAPS
jgi:putative phosphoesterase